MTEPLHIAFCVDDAYAPYIAVTIKSIVETNCGRYICIHVLTDFISAKNERLLTEVAEGYVGVSLKIHTVDDIRLRKLFFGRWSVYTWYRILLPSVLPDVESVLYLDADTLVTDDLSELFELDMKSGGGRSIAAVEDIFSNDCGVYSRLGYDCDKKYICAGVMLMNLDYWRRHSLTEKIIEWAVSNRDRLVAPDQDAINFICQDSKIMLPLRFCIFNEFFINGRYLIPRYKRELSDCLERPAIIHYADAKPWFTDIVQHQFYGRWLEYNRMLPHPVKCRRKQKRPSLKYLLWKITHPSKRWVVLSAGELKRRISEI